MIVVPTTFQNIPETAIESHVTSAQLHKLALSGQIWRNKRLSFRVFLVLVAYRKMHDMATSAWYKVSTNQLGRKKYGNDPPFLSGVSGIRLL